MKAMYFQESREFDKDFHYKELNIKIGKGTKVEYGAVIYENCQIGNHCIIGTNAVLKPETIIGDHSIFGTLSTSEGKVKIGSWTTIHSQCHVTWGMEIGNNVFIAPFFYTANTPMINHGKFGYPNTTNDPRYPPKVEDGVRFGENVGLVPGVTIGHDSLIDMGCLITKDVPSNTWMRSSGGLVARKLKDLEYPTLNRKS